MTIRARHPQQLAQADLDRCPVMDRENRHRRVDGPVGERQGLDGSLQHGSRALGALGDHYR
jgi:hypothetical protein